ncbi:MAG: hypothetical protein AB7P76_05320 [Candidatus Melainabacteria bacterium]
MSPLIHIRKWENLHILFWLLKDISWAMAWKPLGIFMIAPTLGLAVWITWRLRHEEAELLHNCAVACWIIANAFWMVIEFCGVDERLRVWTALPFGLGLGCILWYYARVWRGPSGPCSG